MSNPKEQRKSDFRSLQKKISPSMITPEPKQYHSLSINHSVKINHRFARPEPTRTSMCRCTQTGGSTYTYRFFSISLPIVQHTHHFTTSSMILSFCHQTVPKPLFSFKTYTHNALITMCTYFLTMVHHINAT